MVKTMVVKLAPKIHARTSSQWASNQWRSAKVKASAMLRTVEKVGEKLYYGDILWLYTRVIYYGYILLKKSGRCGRKTHCNFHVQHSSCITESPFQSFPALKLYFEAILSYRTSITFYNLHKFSITLINFDQGDDLDTTETRMGLTQRVALQKRCERGTDSPERGKSWKIYKND